MAVLLSLLLAWAPGAGAAPYAQEVAFYESLVEKGQWNERIYAIHQLGQKGVYGQEGIKKAAQDPDWQVRLTAVHWLGRTGFGDRVIFERIARKEACPWVRLAALHWLGRAGGESPPSSAGRIREDSGACRTWSWSAAEKKGGRIASRSETTGATAVDDKGCQYIHYRKKRGEICPKRTFLRGIGMPPYNAKILKGRGGDAGVALCCPGNPETGPVTAATGRPIQVECRLVPEECPAEWSLLEPTAARPWENRDFKYRRTDRHRQGDLNWVQCCRPHPVDPKALPKAVAVAAPTAPARRRNYLEEEAAFQREERLAAEREEVEQAYPIEGPDEREIARRLLGPGADAVVDISGPAEPAAGEPVSNGERASELDALIASLNEELAAAQGIGETLLPPRGPAPREESRVLAGAERFEPEGELPSERIERLRRELGESEGSLAAPRVPGAREERAVRATPEAVDDHGRPEAQYDALPALLGRLKSKDARTRARAAEALGALGAKGAPAVDPLRAALRDRDPRVSANAAIALGNLTRGSDAAVEDLKRLLDARNPDVRYCAAQALGRIGTPGAQRAFHKSMRSGMRIFLGTGG